MTNIQQARRRPAGRGAAIPLPFQTRMPALRSHSRRRLALVGSLAGVLLVAGCSAAHDSAAEAAEPGAPPLQIDNKLA